MPKDQKRLYSAYMDPRARLDVTRRIGITWAHDRTADVSYVYDCVVTPRSYLSLLAATLREAPQGRGPAHRGRPQRAWGGRVLRPRRDRRHGRGELVHRLGLGITENRAASEEEDFDQLEDERMSGRLGPTGY